VDHGKEFATVHIPPDGDRLRLWRKSIEIKSPSVKWHTFHDHIMLSVALAETRDPSENSGSIFTDSLL
jgi:hypothetical protein